MRRAAVFVLADVRSGSTLLDQCLGGHPDIASLGELHWLSAYLSEDRAVYDPDHPLLCACGASVRACPFWKSVELALGSPLESLQLRQHLKRKDKRWIRPGAVKDLRIALIKSRPGLYRHAAIRRLVGALNVAGDCVRLFDAVSTATGRRFCVDSSKSPYRFRSVFEADPKRTLAVVLARDYRAVVHSKMKRGQSLRVAALGWRRKLQQIRALTMDIPVDCVFSLKYEALCSNPRDELGRLCDFLGISFTESMLHRPTATMHHIGGSPSKFDPSRAEIALDRSFENQFSQAALEHMRELVGDVAVEWGY
jgi:hypothetical protein